MFSETASEQLSVFYGAQVDPENFSGTVVEQILAQCSAHPEAIALQFGEAQLSYRELETRSARIASALAAAGVAKGDRVAVMMKRSDTLLVVLLGILRSGAVYAPIDVDYPISRVDMLIDTLAPKRIICDSEYTGSLEHHPQCTSASALLAEVPDRDGAPVVELAATDPAYVIFTSGSTGKPKGVINSHGGLANRIRWQIAELSHSDTDIFIQKTPYTFDVSVWELFLPFCIGAKLCVLPHEHHKDPLQLKQFLNNHGVTVAHFVPTMLDLFLDSIGDERFDSLHTVVCSGEALAKKTVETAAKKLPATRIVNLYGPTEAAIDVTIWECPKNWDQPLIPLGAAAPNCDLYILDSDKKPVPRGDEGELFIAGPQVALGYLNDPERTAAVFLPDPLSSQPRTMYATGDLASCDAAGNILYLGRIDNQVKLRGQRLEPGEIEFALNACDGVSRSCVLVTVEGGDQVLVACVNSSGGFSEPQARQSLAEQLPAYMLPQRFIEVANWPTTANGKADRKQLLEIASDALRSSDAAQQAAGIEVDEELLRSGDLHALLKSIWQQALGGTEVTSDAPFFDLGGTSLQAARAINALQKILQQEIFVVSLYEHPTLNRYAAFLEANYASSLFEKFGIKTENRAAVSAATSIDAADLDDFAAIIPRHLTTSALEHDDGEALGPAVFVLAPPRSGTSLLRLMLTSHDGLYGGNEIQLLHFANMQDRKKAYSGKFSLWSEGLVRLLMDLHSVPVDEALAMVAALETDSTSTKSVYRQIQSQLGGRLLVDKSPSYALDPLALAKAERDFSAPLYIHLVREPASVVSSFIEHHMEQALYVNEHSFSARQLAELVWTLSHRNITEFLATVPAERQIRVDYAALVGDPEVTMRALCERFGLEFSDAMLNPYEGLERKMVDGIYPESRSMTDPTLLKQNSINPQLATRRSAAADELSLAAVTQRLAATLRAGLPDPADSSAIDSNAGKGRRRSAARNLRARRQR